jgi:hypothetical protein
MANQLFRGAQLHQQFKRSQTISNISAPSGVKTLLPILLGDVPASKQAVRVYFGPVGGPHKFACLGIEFDVDLPDRYVYWLPTARWPIINGEVVIDYYSQGWYA